MTDQRRLTNAGRLWNRRSAQQQARRRRRRGRSVCLGALFALLATASAIAAPSDILEAPGGLAAGEAPESTTIAAGDGKVSGQTGAFGYTVPIAVPPGRVGTAPSLSLSYSSQAPLYGDVAAGWTLGLPVISRDYSEGRYADVKWTSSLAGRELATTDEPAPAGYQSYRAQSDSSFARYQHSALGWRMFQSDGSKLFFGESAYIDGATGADFFDWQPITRSVDKFGNEVRYHWQSVADAGDVVELRISLIEYSVNTAAGLGAHARVEFNYSAPIVCAADAPAVGSKVSYRSGRKRVKGHAPLANIETSVADSGNSFRSVRRYDLAYDQAASSCAAPDRRFDSPNRLLASVSESARSPEGAWTAMPPITFNYGAARDLSAHTQVSPLFGSLRVLLAGRGDATSTPLGDAPKTLFVDMDGDGLADVLYGGDAPDPSLDSRCYLGWRKNLGRQLDGTIALGAETLVPMPTLPWRNHDGWVGTGKLYVDTLGSRGPGELCTVVGQQTLDVDPWGSEEDLDCEGGEAPCAVVPNGYAGAILVYHYTDFDRDGLTDLIIGAEIDPGYYAAPHFGSSEIFECIGGDRIQILGEGPIDYDLNVELIPAPKGTPPLPRPDVGLVPFSPCNNPAGDYGWNVYRNDGAGGFGSQVPLHPDYHFVSDVPVPKQIGEPYPGIGGGGLVGQTKSLIDVDGDGYLDVLDLLNHEPSGDGNGGTLLPWELRVNRWDPPTLLMKRDPNSWAFKTPEHPGALFPSSRRSAPTDTTWSTVRETSRLVDIHGDGLPDILESPTTADGFGVYANLGKASPGSWAFAERQTLGPETSISVAEITQPSHYERQQIVQLRDVDGDGRLDLVTPNSVHWGLGGGWMAGGQLNLAQQKTLVAWRPSPESTKQWSVETDWVDVDGDGLAERVEHDLPGFETERVYHYDIGEHGARRGILHSVDNGRGLTIDVAYAPHVSAEVVTMGDGRLPSPTWVVKSFTRTNAHSAAPPAATRYHYSIPVWNPDRVGRWGYRGFKSVTTTNPSGSRAVSRYEYEADFSGRLATTLTYANGSTEPTTIETTVWRGYATVDHITTYHANSTKQYTCEKEVNGAVITLDEASCRDEEPLVSDTAHGYLESGGRHVAIVANVDVEVIDDPDIGHPAVFRGRCVRRDHALVYSGHDYRIATTKEVAHFGRTLASDTIVSAPETGWDCNGSLASHVETTYDSGLLAPLQTCSARESADVASSGSLLPARAVCTRSDVDLSTGLVVRSQSAEGHRIDREAAQAWTTGVTQTTFDANRLFAVRVENALGHAVTMSTDLGTGAELSSHGPNPHQGTRRQIDGFGRPLSEWISIQDDPDPSQPYHYRKKRDVVYDDAASPITVTERPTRLLSDDGQLEENSNAIWAEIRTSYDGSGRVLEVYEASLQEPIEDPSRRRFSYDASGNLIAVTAPDPAKAKGAAGDVTYAFAYDSLSRRTCAIGPDGSGVATIYGGRRVRTVEFGSDGGDCVNPTDLAVATPRSAAIAEADLFGRVIRLEERTDAVADSWTSTLYDYDANDNLKTITRLDAEHGDILTALSHDFVGNRVAIERHGRLWSYAYDHNSNLVAQSSPVPANGELDDVTISTLYDELDRPISRLVPDGSLGELAAPLGVGETSFEYDQGLFGTGQLTQTVTPLEVIDHRYDARGNRARTTKTVDLSGVGVPLVDSLVVTNLSWNAFDQPATVIHPSGRRTASHYHRWPSAAKSVAIENDDGSFDTLGYARNAAGLATRLTHTRKVGATTHVGRGVSYHYDSLARLTDEFSSDEGDDGDDAISQTMSYYGTSEVATLLSQVGAAASARQFAFSYDDQNQLTAASDDRGYTASFGYTATGRLLSAHVTAGAGPATVVENRNVTYAYNEADPELVSALIDNPSAPLGLGVLYGYDAAGNMTRRDVSGGSGGPASVSTDLLYDADNRLRIRRLADGSEQRAFYDGADRWLLLERAASGQVTGARLWFGGEEIEYACTALACERQTEKTNVMLGGRAVARVERDVASGVAETKLIHANGLGHTLGVYSATLSAGTLSYNLDVGFQYGPFGELLETIAAPSADPTDYPERFNGKDTDPATGLAYYGYRYFDPLALIWNRSDPKYRFAPEFAFVEPRRSSMYSFSGNNPFRYFDPNGLDSVLVIEGGGMAQSFFKGPNAATNYSAAVNRELRRSQLVGEQDEMNNVAVNTKQELLNALSSSTEQRVVFVGHTLLDSAALLAGTQEYDGIYMEAVSAATVGEALANNPNLKSTTLCGCETEKNGAGQAVADGAGKPVKGQSGIYRMDAHAKDKKKPEKGAVKVTLESLSFRDFYPKLPSKPEEQMQRPQP